MTFLGGVWEREESESSSDIPMSSDRSSSLSGLDRFFEAVAFAAGLAVSFVWVNFFGAAFLGAAFALGFYTKTGVSTSWLD